MGDVVHLQFTQADRDILMDVKKDVKLVLDGMATHNSADTERFRDLDKRLEHLETWQTRVMAICGACGAVLGFMARVIWR